MPIIKFVNVSKVFKKNRNEHVVLKNINLEIEKGEFVCIVGASGCGKTTLLNLTLGIYTCTEGDVYIKDKPVKKVNMDCAAVYQDNSLFPWLTVEQNVEFELRMRGVKRQEREIICCQYLNMVKLHNFKTSYIHELSGGMKQRVALSRALATEREILVLDEPFSALDESNRKSLQLELLNVKKKTNKTIVMVTHSETESLFLADRIIKLCPILKNIKEDKYI